MGEQMKAMVVDGVKVIKLDETHEDEKNRQSDALSLFRIWSLLTGEDQMGDLTVANKVHCQTDGGPTMASLALRLDAPRPQ